MFGKGKKEKDIVAVLKDLTPEERADLYEALKPTEDTAKVENNSTNSKNAETTETTTKEEKVIEASEKANDNNPVVEETDQQENGIPISDVMLKSEFQKYVDSFEAKFNAIVKENKDLKEANDKLAKEKEELHNKYETDSFGNYDNKAHNGNANDGKQRETAQDYISKFFK